MIFKKNKFVLIFILVIVLIGTFFLKTGSLTAFLSEKLELKKVFTFFKDKLIVFGQELNPYFPYYFPHYPQRLMYLSSEMALYSDQITSLNEELNSLTGECNCQNAQSRCELNVDASGWNWQPAAVFGDPCPERKKIEENKEKIREDADHLSFLQNLLKEEMASGYEDELKTLRPEVAADLDKNLKKLLEDTPNVVSLAEDNSSLGCAVQSCKSFYSVEAGAEACISTTGEQKPIDLNLEVGVSLDDLKLGNIEVSSVQLDLPKELQLPPLPQLFPLTFSMSGITVTFPEVKIAEVEGKEELDFHLSPITFNIPQPSLPLPPEITLSCSQHSTPSSYQYQGQGSSTATSTETGWYLGIFGWLSQICQEMPEMKDNQGLPATTTECFDQDGKSITKPEGCALMERCFNPEIVAESTTALCDQEWKKYFDYRGLWGILPTESPTTTCQSIGAPDFYEKTILNFNLMNFKTKTERATEKCRDLFTKEKESVPSACGTDQLKNKCDQIRKSGREEIPEECEFLPLFTGQIGKSEAEFLARRKTILLQQLLIILPVSVRLLFRPFPKFLFPA